MKFKCLWINGNKVEPLVVKQLLKDSRAFRMMDESTLGRMFDNSEQPHGLMIMNVPVIHRLKRKAHLQITLASQHHPHSPDHIVQDLWFHCHRPMDQPQKNNTRY